MRSFLILIALWLLLADKCEARVLCTPCMNRLDCEAPPREVCAWGEARDACGRRTCARGPGDRCGGTFNMLGVCGEGMMCTTEFVDKNVERCHGCSLENIECYPEL